MASLIDAIEAQKRYAAKQEERQAESVYYPRKDPLTGPQIIKILLESLKGRTGKSIAKSLRISTTTAYNVLHRYKLCKDERGEWDYMKRDETP